MRRLRVPSSLLRGGRAHKVNFLSRRKPACRSASQYRFASLSPEANEHGGCPDDYWAHITACLYTNVDHSPCVSRYLDGAESLPCFKSMTNDPACPVRVPGQHHRRCAFLESLYSRLPPPSHHHSLHQTLLSQFHHINYTSFSYRTNPIQTTYSINMRTSFFSILALPALFLGAIAAPAPEAAVVEKRQLASAYSIVDALYADIKTYTGAISQFYFPGSFW